MATAKRMATIGKNYNSSEKSSALSDSPENADTLETDFAIKFHFSSPSKIGGLQPNSNPP